MTITGNSAAPDLEVLQERAIALGVEAQKAYRTGMPAAPVVNMSLDAMVAAQEAGAPGMWLAKQIDLRYAAYLLNVHTQVGFEETAALDGDLDHPENDRGEKLDLAGAAA